ncbi:MAG: ABC transporter ATP-binding protein [Bacteroidota bacterium]
MTGPEAALRVEDLGHRYGDTLALDGVTLAVAPGERLALLGENGSGKTTLLRAVSTLLRPDRGRIEVAGVDAHAEPAAARRRLGVVFQSPALDEALTVGESLRLQAALVGLDARTGAERIEAALADLGLADRAADSVGTLSGGLIRRTDLARGLLHRPPLVLLDEPTTGLDPVARDALWDALDRHRAQDETAQVVATHLMDEAERADRVAILHRGRLVRLGAPAELKAEVGAAALWLDTDDAPALTHSLMEADGLDARTVGERVLVRTARPEAVVGALFARADVRAASVQEATMDDVFRLSITEP